ncbi:hypothetical protein EV702DRAFT_1205303 [Suillus placidus]|uniref:KOW domain-containing protein n=1 Tax=Suillus placidus TaxID=48579 RepID=A0A9P6ZFS6_9AGAM|nr:hypothetical protein EV702DRAFT_1205303 [Suillus placidus]
MSKRAGSSHHCGDEPTPKRLRIGEGNHAIPLALHDPNAWEILCKFLTSDMSMGEMDTALESYLGRRFSAEDWEEPRRVLFSGDGDDAQSLANLNELKLKYVPEPEPSRAIPIKQLCKLRKKNLYILDEAEEEEEEEEEEEDGGGPSVRSPKVIRSLGPSAKDRLAATYDNMATRFERNATTPSHGRQVLIEDRMYLLHVQMLQNMLLHTFGIKIFLLPCQLGYRGPVDYTCIKDDEREAVERSRSKLPDTLWVRITKGKYKNDVGKVFKSNEDLVEVLLATREFPYEMPRGTRALAERSHFPNGKGGQVSNIISNDEVVGWSYKGESYYKGLVVKIFHRDYDIPFLKATMVAFSMQFLHVGDSARVVKGSLRGELGTVVSTDHACDSVGLEHNFDGYLEETEVSLRDIEHIFRVGNTVRVVAGPYMGLEGYLTQMSDDVFHVCQETTKEVVEVSKYYLDRRPLRHTLKSHLPTQQHFEPPSNCDSIEIGDYIQVLDGEHTGRRGIVNWFSKGDTNLWFQDIFTANNTEPSLTDLATISVPVAMVQWTDLAQTIAFTKEKGYDVRAGDTVSVTCRPEFGARGLPNARLSLINKDIGHEVFIIGGERKGYRGTLDSLSVETCTVAVALHGQVRTTLKLHDVVTRYGMRLNGVMLQGPELVSFCDMRKRSYLAPPPRSVTPPVKHIPSSSSASVTDSSLPPSNGWTAWSSSVDVEHDPSLSVNPSSSSALQPWSVDALDIQNSIEARTEKLRETGPLPWLMSKEFSLKLSGYHILFKVSVGFMNGRLQKWFVSMACPDPFCGENGPAPEGCMAIFCTSNSAGATLEHYHIPASDLSPAPPRKKNQECLILDGIHRGLIQIVSRCEITKKNTVDIKVTPTVTVTLRSDQICLVERSRQMMQ